jgi:hypothetical protein
MKEDEELGQERNQEDEQGKEGNNQNREDHGAEEEGNEEEDGNGEAENIPATGTKRSGKKLLLRYDLRARR